MGRLPRWCCREGRPGLHPEKKPGPDWRWQKVDWAALRSCHPDPVEGSRHCRAFLEIQKYISPEVAGEVEALIEELGLEVWRVERVEGKGEEEPP